MLDRCCRILTCLFVVLSLCRAIPCVLASESTPDATGFTFHSAIQGSANSSAQVNRLEAGAGYVFNPKFAIDLGLPFYFVNSNLSTDPTQNGFRSGLGNAFVNFKITPTLADWRYVSSLTATAPTGDTDKGFSTGRVTVDWNNAISRSFSRFTPFVNLGVGNTISDTNFFYRPFSSLGLVGHFELGTTYLLARSVSVGASAYSVVPSGEQKIYSRVTKRQNDTSQTPASNASGQGAGRAFETNHVILNDPGLARDHGFATWLTIYPSSTTFLQTGYHRSAAYSLNTFFFGVGLQLDPGHKRIKHP
jgi:hypothetical protein